MREKERNLGIDVLRILCMLAVVVYHLLGHGWIMALINENSWKYELLKALQSATLFGISCFALISGYVGIQTHYRYRSLVLQWLKVWLYSVAFVWIVSLIDPSAVSIEDWDRAIHPVLYGQYWYFTAYVGCYMLMPIVRMAIKRMSIRQASISIGLMVFVFSVLNTVKGGDPFYTNAGKGTLWLVVLYIIGAYFGMFRPHERIPMFVLWGIAVFTMMLLAGADFISVRLGWEVLAGTLRNDSLITLLAAVAMLLLFSRIRITRGKRLAAAFGAASFGVYLIHDHPLIRKYTISTYAYHLAGLNTLIIVPCVILTAAGIYIVCALIDMAREKLFGLLHIKQGLAALEQKVVGNLWDE